MDIVMGVCPTCYLVVTKGQKKVGVVSSDGSVFFHLECEPRRMQFMSDNADEWKTEGQQCKELREKWEYGISELAEDLGVSESKIRKFESGKPVTHAKLMVRSYFYFFRLFELQIKEAIPWEKN